MSSTQQSDRNCCIYHGRILLALLDFHELFRERGEIWNWYYRFRDMVMSSFVPLSNACNFISDSHLIESICWEDLHDENKKAHKFTQCISLPGGQDTFFVSILVILYSIFMIFCQYYTVAHGDKTITFICWIFVHLLNYCCSLKKQKLSSQFQSFFRIFVKGNEMIIWHWLGFYSLMNIRMVLVC